LVYVKLSLVYQIVKGGLAIEQTIGRRLYKTLAEQIITGEIKPGQRLDERDLAERFEVSRTPVREALRGLQERGLVEIMPRRGVIVATISLDGLGELLEAQCELEALVARRAAESMTPMERKELELLHQQGALQAESGDQAGYLETNDQFHATIARGTHNAVLITMLGDLRDRLAPFRRAQTYVDRLAVSHDEHDAIVRAIFAGDPEAAFIAMRDHDARLSNNVLRMIRSRESVVV
jgi:DNA-binding GntR family transcriptional regulator